MALPLQRGSTHTKGVREGVASDFPTTPFSPTLTSGIHSPPLQEGSLSYLSLNTASKSLALVQAGRLSIFDA
jgi:hypothetical protein